MRRLLTTLLLAACLALPAFASIFDAISLANDLIPASRSVSVVGVNGGWTSLSGRPLFGITYKGFKPPRDMNGFNVSFGGAFDFGVPLSLGTVEETGDINESLFGIEAMTLLGASMNFQPGLDHLFSVLLGPTAYFEWTANNFDLSIGVGADVSYSWLFSRTFGLTIGANAAYQFLHLAATEMSATWRATGYIALTIRNMSREQIDYYDQLKGN